MLSSFSKASQLSLVFIFSIMVVVITNQSSTIATASATTSAERVRTLVEEQQQNLTKTISPSIFEANTTDIDNNIDIDNDDNDDYSNNEEDDVDYQYQHNQIISALAPRTSGIVLLMSSSIMFSMAWKRRSKLFHRLIIGMSFYFLMTSFCLIIGTAAVPANDEYTIGNLGTITTCTIQGFLIQVGAMTSITYYCFLSLYSYVGILNNFNQQKIKWIEKYIHCVVHICPLITAFYLVSVEAINKTGIGFCHISSSPLGCTGKFGSKPPFYDYDNDNDITTKCERGPDGYEYVLLFTWTLPLFVMLLGTTIIMIVLYYMVRQRQHQIHIQSRIVAYQSIIYLLALYMALLPYFSTEIVFLLRGRFDKTQLLFALRVFQSLAFSLFGVWSLFAYCYFTLERRKSKTKTIKSPPNSLQNQISDMIPNQQPISDDPSITSNSTTTNNDNDIQNEIEEEKICISTKMSNNSKDEKKQYTTSTKNIFSSHEIEMSSSPSPSSSSSKTTTSNKTTNNEGRTRNNNISLRNITTNPEPRQSSSRYSFNIFDGTNATGTFAEFIHDGDSDDEQIDNEITDHWADVQDFV